MPVSCKHIMMPVAVLAAAFLLFGCNFRQVSPKEALFTKDQAAITAELQSMVACEKVGVQGTQITTNNKTVTSELVVTFVNCKEPNPKQEEVGEAVAAELKKDLQDPNEFDSYKVVFMKKKGIASFAESHTYNKGAFKGAL